MTQAKVTITIHKPMGDDENEGEWVVSDDGGEFDDECYPGEADGDGERDARDDAAGRLIHYRTIAGEVLDIVQEEI